MAPGEQDTTGGGGRQLESRGHVIKQDNIKLPRLLDPRGPGCTGRDPSSDPRGTNRRLPTRGVRLTRLT